MSIKKEIAENADVFEHLIKEASLESGVSANQLLVTVAVFNIKDNPVFTYSVVNVTDKSQIYDMDKKPIRGQFNVIYGDKNGDKNTTH